MNGRFKVLLFAVVATALMNASSAFGQRRVYRPSGLIDRAIRDVDGCVEYLLRLEGVTPKKVGTIGFCMGGQLALAAACKNAKVGGCADFYGVHPNVTLDLSSLQAPVLGIFAANDGFVSAEVVSKLENDIRPAKVDEAS